MANQETEKIMHSESVHNQPIPSFSERYGEPLGRLVDVIDFSDYSEDELNCPDCLPKDNRLVKIYEGPRGAKRWVLALNNAVEPQINEAYAAAMQQYRVDNSVSQYTDETHQSELIKYQNKLALVLPLSFSKRLTLRLNLSREKLTPDEWCVFTLLNDYEGINKYLVKPPPAQGMVL